MPTTLSNFMLYFVDKCENPPIVSTPKYHCNDSICFVFVSFRFLLNAPVNNFSVMSGQSHRFLGITSTFWEVNVSCSRTQYGDLSEDRTPDLSLGVRRSTTRPPRLRFYL